MFTSVVTTVNGIDLSRVKRYDEKQGTQMQFHIWITLSNAGSIFRCFGDYFQIGEYAFYQS